MTKNLLKLCALRMGDHAVFLQPKLHFPSHALWYGGQVSRQFSGVTVLAISPQTGDLTTILSIIVDRNCTFQKLKVGLTVPLCSKDFVPAGPAP